MTADTDRAAILERYRERIATGARTRLTQTEQAALVEAFISDLAQLEQAAMIEQRCTEELAILEEGYPTQTIASKLIAPYRRAIRAAIDAGTLPLNDATSHIVRYTKRATGEQQETQEHWALTHLKYDQATYARLRGQSIEQNNARQDDLQPVQVDRYLEAVTELLAENDPHTLTAAIAAATGRRHTEVVVRSAFTSTEHPYTLQFTGQQKKRGDKAGSDTSFDILTIVPAQTVLDAITRLRAMPLVGALRAIASVNDPALRAFNSQVNREVKRRFEDSGVVPRIAGARRVSIHRLRGVYAAIAVYLWCPEGQNQHRFIQHYLGHISKEEALPNSTATTHYFHYRLLDDHGQPLNTKGILRDTFGAPPEHTAIPASPPAPAQRALRRPTLASTDLSRLQQLTTQLGFGGSLAERLHALLGWAEEKCAVPTVPDTRATQELPQTPQEQPDTPDTPNGTQIPPEHAEQPQEAPGTPLAPSATPTPAMLPVVADQAKTLAWLTDEISSLRQQLAAAQQANHDAHAERGERGILQAKIDSLASENKTLRRRLERFDSIRQALLGGNGDNGEAQETPPASAGPQTIPAAPQTTEAHAQAEPASTTPRTTAPSTSRGQERANRIWEVVRQWNEALDRVQAEKVALSATVLEKRFGLFRPTAKAWLQTHQQEVEDHNVRHGITAPTHNRGVPEHVWEQIKQQAS